MIKHIKNQRQSEVIKNRYPHMSEVISSNLLSANKKIMENEPYLLRNDESVFCIYNYRSISILYTQKNEREVIKWRVKQYVR